MTTKERPILFSGPMVKALLDRRKTQTRRIVGKGDSIVGTGVPWEWLSFEPPWPEHCHLYKDGRADDGGEYLHVPCKPHPEDPQGLNDYWTVHRVYPRIEPGDRLWVRETWQYYDWTEDGEPYIRYRSDDLVVLRHPTGEVAQEICDTVWAELSAPQNYDLHFRACDQKWRSSIFMPRWASRITLEVTDVRVERLRGISCADVYAEGVMPRWHEVQVAREQFSKLWESINGPGSWDANPWVWVIEFKRMTPTTPQPRREG